MPALNANKRKTRILSKNRKHTRHTRQKKIGSLSKNRFVIEKESRQEKVVKESYRWRIQPGTINPIPNQDSDVRQKIYSM